MQILESNIPQNVIHGFRTVVNDLGCNIGYIITIRNFQSGSIRSSEYTNVELLNWERFQELFFQNWNESYFSIQIEKLLEPIFEISEPFLPE